MQDIPPSLQTCLEGVTALQPTAAFAKLKPSRRQDEQPEKWLGSGRDRVPDLSRVQQVLGDSIGWAGSRCFAAHRQMLYFCSVRVQAVKCWTPTGATLAGIFTVSLRDVLMKLEALSRALNPTSISKAVVPGGSLQVTFTHLQFPPSRIQLLHGAKPCIQTRNHHLSPADSQLPAAK